MFTRMDEGSQSQWLFIRERTLEGQERAGDRILGLLRRLESEVDGYAVNQLVHSLQTASRAEAAGAADDVVVASLCHDLGKVVSTANHAAIGAEMIRPYLSVDLYDLVLAHQEFEARHYARHFNWDPDGRLVYRDRPWYALAETFADEWDQLSFDPTFPTPPLEHFEHLVRSVFDKPATITY